MSTIQLPPYSCYIAPIVSHTLVVRIAHTKTKTFVKLVITTAKPQGKVFITQHGPPASYYCVSVANG